MQQWFSTDALCMRNHIFKKFAINEWRTKSTCSVCVTNSKSVVPSAKPACATTFCLLRVRGSDHASSTAATWRNQLCTEFEVFSIIISKDRPRWLWVVRITQGRRQCHPTDHVDLLFIFQKLRTVLYLFPDKARVENCKVNCKDFLQVAFDWRNL